MIRLLIADDFALLREDLRDKLLAFDDMAVVAEAASGEEAVRLADATEPDCVLMDISMESETAGIQATERILESRPQTRVIFLTVHEDENMVLLSLGAGAADYVVKGSDIDTLVRHIRAAMAGEPQLEERFKRMVMRDYARLRKSEQSLLYFIHTATKLTPAERTLVRYLLDGDTVREIAALRTVEMVTVKTQIKSLLRKFGCRRSAEIVRLIRSMNIEHLF